VRAREEPEPERREADDRQDTPYVKSVR